MPKAGLENYLSEIHSRYESLLDHKSISFVTIVDDESLDKIDRQITSLIETIHELVLFTMVNLSNHESDIHHSIRVNNESKRVEITFLTSAYLSLIFDKNDKGSVRKSVIISDYVRFSFESLLKEIKAIGGKAEYFSSDSLSGLSVINFELPLNI